MSQNDLSKNQVIVNAILSLETEKQINDYLKAIDFKPDTEFLECLREKTNLVKDIPTVAKLGKLDKRFTKYLCQYALYELTRLAGEAAYDYLQTHYYLILNNNSYARLEEYILEFKNDRGWNERLTGHKEWLCHVFANGFYTLVSWDDEWQSRRRLLLEGLSWLADPVSEAYFLEIRIQQDAEKQNKLDILHGILHDCLQNGVEKEVAIFDREWFMTRIKETEGIVKLSYLKGATKALKVFKPLSAASFYISMGYLLTDLAVEAGDYDGYMVDALEAYEQACLLLPRPDEQELISYTRRLQAELLQKQTNITIENEQQILEYYKLSLSGLSEVAFPIEWANIHAGLAMFYYQRKHGFGAKNRIKGFKAVSAALNIACRNGLNVEILRCILLLELIVIEMDVIDQEMLQNAVEVIKTVVATVEDTRTKTKLNILRADFLAKTTGEERENSVEVAIGLYLGELEKLNGQEQDASANIHVKLAHLLFRRNAGDPLENEEGALFHYECAFPYLSTFSNEDQLLITLYLTKSYFGRKRGNKLKNFEKAKTFYDQAKVLLKNERTATDVEDLLPELNDTFWARLFTTRDKAIGEIEEIIDEIKVVLSPGELTDMNLTFDRAGAFVHFYSNNGNSSNNMLVATHNLERILDIELGERGTEQGAAETYYLLGRCYADMKEKGAMSITCFTKAAAIWKDLSSYDKLMEALIGQAEVHLKLMQWSEAYQICHQAQLLSEQMRNGAEKMETRKLYAEKHAGVYQGLVTSLLELGEVDKAALHAINSKNKTYTEGLAALKSRKILLETDMNIKERLVALDSERYCLVASKLLIRNALSGPDEYGVRWVQPNDGPNPALQQIESKISQMTDNLIFDYPGLSGWKSLSNISLDGMYALSDKLGPAPLIEYVTHYNRIGAFVFFSGQLNYVELLVLNEEIIKSYTALMQGFLDNTFWENEDSQNHLMDLYDTFIAPIVPFLPESGRLYIAPTTILHWLPFQALCDRVGKYLIESYSIIYIDSMASLNISAAHVQEGKSEANPKNRHLLSISFAGDGEEYLSKVDEEAALIQVFFEQITAPDKYLCDPETIMALANGHEYDVIHFSGHSTFNFDCPGQSGLHLTQQQLLTVDDIRLRFSLNGRPLVTLSSCLSGQSGMYRGDAITGLATAFVAAGASCVLCSMWPVSDQTTMELFNHFYRYRNMQGVDDSEALRSAMISLREKRVYKNRPELWAAFKLFGLPKIY